MRMKLWPLARKMEALTIAETLSPKEAEQRTGIPRRTIYRWVQEVRKGDGSDTAGSGLGARAEELRKAGMEKAVSTAVAYTAEKLQALAERSYAVAEKVTGRVEEVIAADAGEDDNLLRAMAVWLRALTGVYAQYLDRAQLLSGNPTARPEVTGRREYGITQRIVAAQPELIDAIFAPDGTGEGERER